MKISLDKCEGRIQTLVSGNNFFGFLSRAIGVALAQLQDGGDKETAWLAVTSR